MAFAVSCGNTDPNNGDSTDVSADFIFANGTKVNIKQTGTGTIDDPVAVTLQGASSSDSAANVVSVFSSIGTGNVTGADKEKLQSVISISGVNLSTSTINISQAMSDTKDLVGTITTEATGISTIGNVINFVIKALGYSGTDVTGEKYLANWGNKSGSISGTITVMGSSSPYNAFIKVSSDAKSISVGSDTMSFVYAESEYKATYSGVVDNYDCIATVTVEEGGTTSDGYKVSIDVVGSIFTVEASGIFK